MFSRHTSYALAAAVAISSVGLCYAWPPEGKVDGNEGTRNGGKTSFRTIYECKASPATDIGSTLSRFFGEESGLKAIADPLSNSLLLSGPGEIHQEVLAVVSRLDRLPESIEIEVLLVETTLSTKDLGDQELSGPSDKVRAKIEALANGKTTRCKRIQVATVNNQIASVHVGGEKKVISSATMNQQTRVAHPVLQPKQLGCIVTLTSRVVPQKGIMLEYSIRDESVQTDGRSAVLGEGAEGPIVATDIASLHFSGTKLIPTGQAVAVQSFQSDANATPTRVFAIISAKVE